MTIFPVQMICPKCHHEYTNHFLGSYNSDMIEHAKAFVENNKVIVNCESCDVKLISPKYINRFDEKW